MIEESLFDYLTSYAALAALIGTRLYPIIIPENKAHPAIAYQLLDGDEGETHQGSDGMFYDDFQFTVQDKTHEGLLAACAALRAAMKAWKGTSGSYTVIRAARSLEVDGSKSESGIYVRRIQYSVQYT